MKVIIAGSRELNVSLDTMQQIIEKHAINDITEVVSGGARGIDHCGEEYAKALGIWLTIMHPAWKLHSPRYAAYVRNIKMAQYADKLLAIWDGKSKGTRHMIEQMKELGKPYYVEISKT
jgi:hypothetical protein